MFSIFLLPVCLTYWPRKYTTRVDPRVDNSHQVWSWYYHPLRVKLIAFLSAHTSRDLVTLTFDLLTLKSWRAWRVTWLTLPPSLNTIRLSVLDLWVITFPFGYQWECVRTRMRRITWPDLPIHYTTSLGLRRRLRVIYSRASPLLKPA